MRTTIDLPDDLYRSLKSRAALSGLTMRELIKQLVEQGLRQSRRTESTPSRRAPPPVIIPPRGVPIRAVGGAAVRRLEEEEDERKHARSARR